MILYEVIVKLIPNFFGPGGPGSEAIDLKLRISGHPTLSTLLNPSLLAAVIDTIFLGQNL